MPNFIYEAVTATGRKVKGQVQAVNKHSAISELRDKGYTIRSVQEKSETLLDLEISIGRLVKLEDFVIFCRQFATLIRSGIQIDQSLVILEDQSTSKHLKKALGQVADQVRGGFSISQSMESFPKIFPEMFVNMIRSAEAGGNLDDVLLRMADHYEKEHKTIQKVKSAMTYPIIVIIIAIIVVIFLLINIVPTFAGMFEEQGAELPFITRAVMGVSDFIQGYWWLMLILLIGAGVLLNLAMKDEKVKYSVDQLKFKLPVFGSIIKKAAIARMARTLSSLFVSAVPVLSALDITQKVVGNRVLAKVMNEAKESLSEGRLLSEPFAKSELFPKMVLQMLSVGEETGQVDQMLGKIADFYEDDVEQSVDRLKGVVEPLMLLVVSGIVGIIVAAIMTPMFGMYEHFLN